MLMDPQSFLLLPLSSLCPFLHLSSFFTHIGSLDQAFQPHATPVTPRHRKSGRGPQSATRQQRSPQGLVAFKFPSKHALGSSKWP
ncbi:hypothetical protein DFH08DRAFT_854758 [Mycena albidolilacea]|uniref:Uncharacterized protein n=1 Tax=Mycena albidolilacea TaxID=1033008 RepID=A0AAD7ABS7_9AGAR|nr:hypothetical protein DFH08DRAFT_854758 [Mycena albidolilacea]